MTIAYTLLPFQFGRFQGDQYLIVNESGEYHFFDRDELELLVKGILPASNRHFADLSSKQFLVTGNLVGAIDMVATRYRTRKRFLSNFTALHMLVLTLRCNQNCKYCQVSAESDSARHFDMTPEVAARSVEMAFMSPSPTIKIEFQGGEPTLNWETLVRAIEKAEELNIQKKKNLEFVVCTNLTSMTKKKLEFLRKHHVFISTSLDGPQYLHDKNRVLRSGGGTHQLFLENLQEAIDVCGHDKINALMTTTVESVNHLKEVVDEYVRLGFSGIFFRTLNPYGLSAHDGKGLSYSMAHFAQRFKGALDYLIEVNLKGIFFIEFFTSLFLSRILTPFSTGFVDLQSPAGAGISGVIYDYNGDVYPADEARMLARMGDRHFFMGNIFKNTYQEIFNGPVLHKLVAKSCVETMPGCASCVYRTYCGADPIRNYLETGNIIGRRPGNGFCEKNRAILNILFEKLKENNDDIMDVFWSWITRRRLKEIRGENV